MFEFVVAFVLFYMWHGMGVTVGYHRLLSHRSFRVPKAIEYFWVLGGYLAFEGSPMWWAAMHRAHHRYVDTPLDPHSPRYGIKNAHYGWIFHKGYPEHIVPGAQCPDLYNDRVYRLLDCGGDWHKAHILTGLLGTGFRVVLLVLFGWQVALASLLAGLCMLQIPLLLNVVCHIPRLGYKNYALEDDSVNVWWVSLLAHGEGWHNNHHAFPGSARTGMKWYEFDVSWWHISFLRQIGLATDVHEAVRKPDIKSVAASKEPVAVVSDR